MYKVINKARQTIPVIVDTGNGLEYVQLARNSKNQKGEDVFTKTVTDTLANLQAQGLIKLEKVQSTSAAEQNQSSAEQESKKKSK